MLKSLLWLGSSRDDIRDFPPEAKKRVGYELYLVQSGLGPSDWKPMSAVGPGVHEIRVRSGREHRVLYVAKFEEGIYVLHAFEKKTQRTSKADLELARQRLREVLKRRRTGNKS
jgi:phage-related protein